jgi:hypothetical protein
VKQWLHVRDALPRRDVLIVGCFLAVSIGTSACAGVNNIPSDNAPDGAPPSTAAIVNETSASCTATAAALAPFYQNGWRGWPAGTRLRVTFLDTAPDGLKSYVQNDIVYQRGELDDEWFSLQETGGKTVRQQLYVGAHDGGIFAPATLYTRGGSGLPASMTLACGSVDTIRYEVVDEMDIIGVDEESSGAVSLVSREWVLPDDPAIWIRREDGAAGDGYVQIRTVGATCSIADKELSCIAVEQRIRLLSGHVLETRYLSASVPGFLVEQITDIYTEDGSFRTHQKIVEIVVPEGQSPHFHRNRASTR